MLRKRRYYRLMFLCQELCHPAFGCQFVKKKDRWKSAFFQMHTVVLILVFIEKEIFFSGVIRPDVFNRLIYFTVFLNGL